MSLTDGSLGGRAEGGVCGATASEGGAAVGEIAENLTQGQVSVTAGF